MGLSSDYAFWVLLLLDQMVWGIIYKGNKDPEFRINAIKKGLIHLTNQTLIRDQF